MWGPPGFCPRACPVFIKSATVSSRYRSFLTQTIQITAARLLTHSHMWTHISSTLLFLHWLLVEFWMQCKILILTYRALHGQALQYIINLLQLYTISHALRSTQQGFLSVSRTSLKTHGDSARLWNSLPSALRH